MTYKNKHSNGAKLAGALTVNGIFQLQHGTVKAEHEQILMFVLRLVSFKVLLFFFFSCAGASVRVGIVVILPPATND